jgi:PAS domain S-box-containing protein
MELYGLGKPEDLVGRSAFELIAPEDHDRALANLKKTLKDGSVRNVEYRFIRKDGTRFPGALDAALIRDASGQPKCFIGTTRDITSRKQAEEALALQRERLDATLSSIGEGVIATDRNGRMVIFNTSAEDLTGWKEQDALGRDVNDVFNIIKEASREPYGNQVPAVLEADRNAGLITKRAILVAKNGTERRITFSLAPIRAKANAIEGVVVVFADITGKTNQIRCGKCANPPD